MNKLIKEIQKLAFLSALLFLSACNNNSKELEKPNFMHTECNQYILTGPPGFVLSCCEKLKNKGINSTRIPSDVFSYAP